MICPPRSRGSANLSGIHGVLCFTGQEIPLYCDGLVNNKFALAEVAELVVCSSCNPFSPLALTTLHLKALAAQRKEAAQCCDEFTIQRIQDLLMVSHQPSATKQSCKTGLGSTRRCGFTVSSSTRALTSPHSAI